MLENTVEKAQQSIHNLLVELRATREYHAGMLAQLDGMIEQIEAVTTETPVVTKKPRKNAKVAKVAKVAKAAAKVPAARAKTSSNASGGKLDPSTPVEAAGFSPRVVKFCKSSGIQVVGDFAKHDIRALAKDAERIGEKAIVEMLGALKRTGLKPNVQASNGTAHA